MQLHLPAELQAICNFSTLKLESVNFVEEDLRPYFSDVLYSLKTTVDDQHKDKLMTIAQQLEQKGIEKGIQLGEQRGIEKGKLDIARTMLENGLDHNTITKLTGLTAEHLAQIQH